jgi:hypothetical protein
MTHAHIVIATPLNGARVRKPDGQILKAEGERIVRDSFWVRRAVDGDVELAEPAPAAKPPRARKTKTK